MRSRTDARSAADDENEACARIVEAYISDYDIEHNPSATEALRRAAASIRARRKGDTTTNPKEHHHETQGPGPPAEEPSRSLARDR